MHLHFRNVNNAFSSLVQAFASGGVLGQSEDRLRIVARDSRYGKVLVIEEPMTITYLRPTEKVLFNEARDANPFFHLYESLWMLAGREDVAPLAFYNSRMPEFSDDGKVFNGAYGNRWRNWKVPRLRTTLQRYSDARYDGGITGPGEQVERVHWKPVDQLSLIAERLRNNPDDRRCVLEMWSVHSDLLRAGGETCPVCYRGDSECEHEDPDHTGQCIKCTAVLDCERCGGQGRTRGSKDVCCNTHVYFSMRDQGKHGPKDYVLDMTVCNRSNDLIWGMLGANVVHFAFLQEYLAAKIGCKVGEYSQFTNNLHVYQDRFDPESLLREEMYRTAFSPPRTSYESLKTVPLQDTELFDCELGRFVEIYSGKKGPERQRQSYAELNHPFLLKVAIPMCEAFACWKEKDFTSAFQWMDMVEAEDWAKAGRGWLHRRYMKHLAKEEVK